MHELEARLAREFLAAAKTEGLFDLMHEMATRKRAVAAITFPSTQPGITAVFPELGIARKLARINAARFDVAREEGDATELGRAMEANLALARMCSLQGTMIHGLVGEAIESLAVSRAVTALVRSPSVEVVEAISQAIDRQAPRPDILHTLRGEYLYELDTVCWIFGDPRNVRFGRLSPRLKRIGIEGSFTTPLGFYWQNRDELAALYAYFTPIVTQEPNVRPAGAGAYAVPRLLLLETMTPAINRGIEVEHHANLMRRGIRAMLALEKHRIERGSYPASLVELVPAYLDALPLDPGSGKPLAYRRVEPVGDPNKRGFLLYSVGSDMQDNGGTPCADDCFNAGRTAGNTDFIINRPSW